MKKLMVVLLVLLVPGGLLRGERPQDPPVGGRQDHLLAQIAKATADVQTLASDFIQERHLDLLENVLISKGRFYYKKENRLRWELTEPVLAGFAVNGDKARRWRGPSGPTQTFEVHSVPFIKVFADQVLAWARADFAQLRRRYRITVLGEAPADLELVPVYAQEQKYLDHLRIVFAPDASHVRSVEVYEIGGDFTRVCFSNTIINEPLRDALFD
ncbi:MAG: outer membrane lipoprotein carrier protein LolA [Desulfobacterales bacterium]|nr:MAG: outer membrane lipoprotein carrier protein LolA [Desulfobacterales bacterium]